MMKATMIKQNQARMESAQQRGQMNSVETAQATAVQSSPEQQVREVNYHVLYH